MTNLPANVKVIYHFMANLRTACRNFIITCANVFVIADIVLIVNSQFSSRLGSSDITGEGSLEELFE